MTLFLICKACNRRVPIHVEHRAFDLLTPDQINAECLKQVEGHKGCRAKGAKA